MGGAARRQWLYATGPKTLSGAAPPLLIGGTGGSGTRVVAEIARAAGYYLGSNPNFALDSRDLTYFAHGWLALYLLRRRYRDPRPGSTSAAEGAAMMKALEEALVHHRAGIGDHHRPWALKHTRIMFMWPALNARFP